MTKRNNNMDGGHGINFSIMPAIYWNNQTKISYLQRRIIVYSIMYYQYNESCVSDRFYDGISRQLVKLMEKCTKAELEQTQYWYAMYDFDGSTGFDIPDRLTAKDRTYLEHIANKVYTKWKSESGKVVL